MVSKTPYNLTDDPRFISRHSSSGATATEASIIEPTGSGEHDDQTLWANRSYLSEYIRKIWAGESTTKRWKEIGEKEENQKEESKSMEPGYEKYFEAKFEHIGYVLNEFKNTGQEIKQQVQDIHRDNKSLKRTIIITGISSVIGLAAITGGLIFAMSQQNATWMVGVLQILSGSVNLPK